MSEFNPSGVSRRQLLKRSAVAASAIPLLSSVTEKAEAQAPATPPPPQWGAGPIRVLMITAFHPFERGPFFDLLDSFGKEITWTHVDHPAAEAFFDPAMAEQFDVFMFYDAFAGSKRVVGPDGRAQRVPQPPSVKLQKGTKALLQKGKAMVFLHHSIASWVHTWPQYVEIMGAAADWGAPLKNIRGKDYPFSGYYPGQQQHITVLDKEHPVTQGLGDGFDIIDEAYLNPVFDDSFHPLLKTNYPARKENYPLQLKRDPNWNHPPCNSDYTAWVKTAEKSPIVYIQHGHDHLAWENPAFRRLVMNGIRWAASKEAMAWAAAHPKKIFA